MTDTQRAIVEFLAMFAGKQGGKFRLGEGHFRFLKDRYGASADTVREAVLEGTAKGLIYSSTGRVIESADHHAAKVKERQKKAAEQRAKTKEFRAAVRKRKSELGGEKR